MADLTPDEAWELHDLDQASDLTPDQAWRAYDLRQKRDRQLSLGQTLGKTFPLQAEGLSQDEKLGLPMMSVGATRPQLEATAKVVGPEIGAEDRLQRAIPDLLLNTAPLLPAVSALKKNVLDPYVIEPAQDLTRSILNPGLEAVGDVSPLTEKTLRSVGSLGLGPHIPAEEGGKNIMSPAKNLAATNQLEELANYSPLVATGVLSPQEGGAFGEAALSGLANIPIYLLPGPKPLKAEGTVSKLVGGAGHGALAGTTQELVTPGGDLGRGAAMGAAFGAGFGVAGRVAKAIAGKFKPIEPVAFTPPDEVADLARKLGQAPIEPGAALKDVGAQVATIENGKLVTKDIMFGQEGPVAIQPRGQATAVAKIRPDRAPPLVAPEVQEQLTDAELASLDQNKTENILASLRGTKGEVAIFSDGQLSPSTDPLKLAIEPQGHYENGVLVADVDSGLRIQDINSQAFRRASLRGRGLAEITMPDGSKKLGFVTHVEQPRKGDFLIARPEPAEGLPNALTEDIVVSGSKYRLIDRADELDKVMRASNGWQSSKAGTPENAVNLRKPEPELPIEGLPGQVEEPPKTPDLVPPNEDLALEYFKRAGNQPLSRWVGSHSTGPLAARQLAGTMYAVNAGAFRKTEQDVMAQLQRVLKLKPEQTRQFAQDVNAVLEKGRAGQADYDALRAKWPQVAKDSHDYTQRLLDQVQRNHDTLVKLDAVMPAEGQGLDPGYDGHRMYLRHLLPPGRYAEMVSKDAGKMARWNSWVLDNVVKDVKHPAHALPLSEQKQVARAIVDEIIGMSDSRGRTQGQAGADYLNALRGRNDDLAPMIREMLGESDNGLFRIARTLAHQEAAIANAKIWKEVSGMTDIAAPYATKTPEGVNFRQLPADKSRFGAMAGKYLHPDWYDSLIEWPGSAKAATNWLANFTRYVKMNQVILGGVGPWLKNLEGNFVGAYFAGGVRPFGMPWALYEYAGDLKAYRAEAGAPTSEAAQRVARYRELLGAGKFAASELTDAQRTLERNLAKNLTLEGKVPPRAFMDVLQDATIGNVKGGVGKLGELYEAIDTTFKYTSWAGLLKKGGIHPKTGEVNRAAARKFLGKLYIDTTTERLKVLVEREAARRVLMSFPFMDRMGPRMRTATQNAGFMAPYLGIRSEMLRTYGNAAMRAAEGEPGMRARMAELAGTVGVLGLTAQQMRQANGISDDEISEAWKNQPDSVKRFAPSPAALWWRDAQGRPQFWDMGAMFEPLSYLQGPPPAPGTPPDKYAARMAQNILGNVLVLPFEGGQEANDWQTLLASYGLAEAPPDSQTARYKMSAWRTLDTAWRKGLGPTFVPRTLDRLQAGGLIGERSAANPRPVPTSAQAIINAALGNRVIPGARLENRGQEFLLKKREADKEINQARYGLRKEGQIEGPLQGLFGPSKKEQFLKALKRYEELGEQYGEPNQRDKEKKP